LLSVVALMVVMLAFFVATAYAAKQNREVACEHRGFAHVPFCEPT